MSYWKDVFSLIGVFAVVTWTADFVVWMIKTTLERSPHAKPKTDNRP